MSEPDRNDADLMDDEECEDTQENKYLTFVVNNEEFGIEIRYVTEIIGLQNITGVPDMPYFIKGVINLRGKVIPVMDVRLRFGIAERAYDGRTCIVVISVEDQLVGLIVDRVSEVLDVPQSEIDPPPALKKGEGSRFIQGMGKIGNCVKMLLDARTLLFDREGAKVF